MADNDTSSEVSPKMTWERSILVLTNLPVTSGELGEALATELTAYAARGAATFTLIASAMPFGGGREDALGDLADAISRLRESGLTADVVPRDSDPLTSTSSFTRIANSWLVGRPAHPRLGPPRIAAAGLRG